jgi:putative nucleotidyltransferase with HDIG domain
MAEVVSADRTRLITLKLGALFHDIAKPQTRTVGDDNEIHFYNHPVEGVAIAEEALRRLRFSTNEIRIVSTIILNHMRPAQMAADPQVTRKAVYRFFRDAGSTGVDTLLLSLADHIGTRGPRLNPSAWWQHAQFVRLMLEQHYAQPEPAARLPKLMTGDQIMKHFNLPAGPRIGELLEELHEAQATGEVGTREQALAFVRARISAQDPGVV